MSGSLMGSLIGGLLGNMFDKKHEISQGQDRSGYTGYRKANPRVREFVFVSNLVTLMTSVAKADREIHAEEIKAIKAFFEQSFHYTGHDGKVIENLIRESAGRKIDVELIADDMRHMLDYPEQLMLVSVLYTIALSDRVFKEVEKNRIQQIVDYLGISKQDHDHLKNEFSLGVAEDNYRILDISPEATDRQVKEAYREMVKKFHPDRVAHLGKDFAKLAHEKFQRIQDAYQKISKERELK